mmetsp:Transcript_3602/g.5304  ORF Transcript_3602/g.5304 Transcript_3602/m.5304 type:complete len:136 (+) Transcript_3602:154-561(+)
MRVSIRFAKTHGHKNQRIYQVLVQTSTKSPKAGSIIERVGVYSPYKNKAVDGSKLAYLDIDRIKYWLSHGAQPSRGVYRLLQYANVLPPQNHALPLNFDREIFKESEAKARKFWRKKRRIQKSKLGLKVDNEEEL